MIVFDLQCRNGGHRFEGWFGSSADFAEQQERGLVSCPTCGSADIGKALMAPNLGRKGNQHNASLAARSDAVSNVPMPPAAHKMLEKLAKIQAEALKDSRWVGSSFAEDARAMHYGERDSENIHGQATLREARDLLEEGIGVAPLPLPIAPPEETN